jgi:hypothetical protein
VRAEGLIERMIPAERTLPRGSSPEEKVGITGKEAAARPSAETDEEEAEQPGIFI